MIDYAKYENMDEQQLLNELSLVKKKTQELTLETKENKEVFKFLKAKLKKKKREKCYTLEELPLFKKMKRWEEKHPKKAKKIKKELQKCLIKEGYRSLKRVIRGLKLGNAICCEDYEEYKVKIDE